MKTKKRSKNTSGATIDGLNARLERLEAMRLGPEVEHLRNRYAGLAHTITQHDARIANQASWAEEWRDELAARLHRIELWAKAREVVEWGKSAERSVKVRLAESEATGEADMEADLEAAQLRAGNLEHALRGLVGAIGRQNYPDILAACNRAAMLLDPA